MSAHHVYLLVELTIHDGKFDAFEATAKQMIADTPDESGAIGYEWHLSPDRTRCRILETYADANALLAHLKGHVVQELVPVMLESSSIDRAEVYGDPGDEAREMLAGLGAGIFERWQGFHR